MSNNELTGQENKFLKKLREYTNNGQSVYAVNGPWE
jgi:hypothetical protein